MRPYIWSVTIGVINNKNSEIAIETLDFFISNFFMTTHKTNFTFFEEIFPYP